MKGYVASFAFSDKCEEWMERYRELRILSNSMYCFIEFFSRNSLNYQDWFFY